MRNVTLAATQFACTWDTKANVGKAEALVREAAAMGANVVLLQELFETPYFCQDQSADHFALAMPFDGHPLIAAMASLAKALGVVLPVSFFERANQLYFNSLAMIDADGSILGLYRKSHIPDGPGYQEKYYFTPGDTGFKVWSTRFGRIGAAICWDQWFPESARAMALMGAEALLYPTAIGSEPPPAAPVDSRDHWRRTMQGHAAANYMPLMASNRSRHGEGRRNGDDILRLVLHRRSDRRHRRRARPRNAGRSSLDLRSRCDREGTCVVGIVPRPPSRSLRRASRPHRSPIMRTALSFIAGSIALAGAATAAPITLVPARAVYDVSLSRTVPGGPVVAHGRTVTEFRDACTGWTMTQRFVADMTTSDGNSVRSDLVATSWEAKDGHAMKFTLKNALNGKTAEHFEGTAQLAAAGNGAVQLTVPRGTGFSLPAGAVLPTEHTLDVLRAIASGSDNIHQLVFQGGDKSDLYDATVLIGRQATAAEMAGDRAHDPDGLIAHESARTVLISYFAYGSRDPAPAYEVAYRLYGNGVVSAMSLIYSNFTLSADLTSLEKLAPECGTR